VADLILPSALLVMCIVGVGVLPCVHYFAGTAALAPREGALNER